MKVMSKKEQELLESFVVGNSDLESLETLIAGFNIFEAIGMVKQEIRHSHFLAFLLNPSVFNSFLNTLLTYRTWFTFIWKG